MAMAEHEIYIVAKDIDFFLMDTIFLPFLIIVLCGCFYIFEYKNDIMQRRSFKSGQQGLKNKNQNNGKSLTSIPEVSQSPNSSNQTKKNIKNNNNTKKTIKKNYSKQNNNINHYNNNNYNNNNNININNYNINNNNNDGEDYNNNINKQNCYQMYGKPRKPNSTFKRQNPEFINKIYYKPKTICCTQRELNNTLCREEEKSKQSQPNQITLYPLVTENCTEYKKSNMNHEDFFGKPVTKSSRKFKKTPQRCEIKRKQIEESPIKVEPTIKNLELLLMDIEENEDPKENFFLSQKVKENKVQNSDSGDGEASKKIIKILQNPERVKNNSNWRENATSCSLGTGSSAVSPTYQINCFGRSTFASPKWATNQSTIFTKHNTAHFRKIAKAFVQPDRLMRRIDISEAEMFFHLQRYLIDRNLLRVYGFPIESAIHKGCIEIFKCLPKQTPKVQLKREDLTQAGVINENDGLHTDEKRTTASEKNSEPEKANAVVISNSDSGQSSGELSPPLIESDVSETGEDEQISTTAIYTPDGTYQVFSHYDQSLEKQCVRCNRPFLVNASGEYLSFEPCQFHWGRLYQVFGGNYGYGYIYSCCNKDENSKGCTYAKLHVWTGAVIGLNGPYSDYFYTRPRWNLDLGPKVYALDCEMSFTGKGLELTKVTLISYNGKTVYEAFVHPELEIIDYNTQFSGITADDLSSPNVKTLPEVQIDLLNIIDQESILVGHGLDNDLRVLRIVHKNIVDTSIVFPHASGFPYRRSLKHLAKLYLSRDIQNTSFGHNSLEDSRACLDLIIWRLQTDMVLARLP